MERAGRWRQTEQHREGWRYASGPPSLSSSLTHKEVIAVTMFGAGQRFTSGRGSSLGGINADPRQPLLSSTLAFLSSLPPFSPLHHLSVAQTVIRLPPSAAVSICSLLTWPFTSYPIPTILIKTESHYGGRSCCSASHAGVHLSQPFVRATLCLRTGTTDLRESKAWRRATLLEVFWVASKAFDSMCGFVECTSHLALPSEPFCSGALAEKDNKKHGLKRKEAFKGRQRRVSGEITLWLVREDIRRTPISPSLAKEVNLSSSLWPCYITSNKGLFGLSRCPQKTCFVLYF